MNILFVGNSLFRDALAGLGHRVRHCACRDNAPRSWNDLVEEAGFEPDVVVVADLSRAPFVGRIERFPCLTVFMCVDSHIHSWYPAYAQAFDLCTVSLRDHIERFRTPAPGCRLPQERVLWLPPYARDDDLPPAAPPEKFLDLLFVGNVHPEQTPQRKRFLDSLARRFPGLAVRQGRYRELYPTARIVLNIAERGDLNFRVFEALGMQCCLLTPRVGHGQDTLFAPERDLFLYESGDVEHALEQTRRLLAEPETQERAAAAGRARIDAGHRARHRAASFARFIENQPARELVTERLDQGRDIHRNHLRLIYLHWAEALRGHALSAAYLSLARYSPGLDV